MDSPVIHAGILLSEGKKVLRCMERICVSQSPRLKWLHLNSFLVFSVWFKLTGTLVNSLHSCSPSFNGSARFWSHNEGKSPQSPGCLSKRMMGDVVGEFSPFLHARVRVCLGMSVSASIKEKMGAGIQLPASCFLPSASATLTPNTVRKSTHQSVNPVSCCHFKSFEHPPTHLLYLEYIFSYASKKKNIQ